MTNNMTDEQINKIAQAIAAKVAEPGGPVLLGCGSASSTSDFSTCSASSYDCSNRYECGGAGSFTCTFFRCDDDFTCYARHNCGSNFRCTNVYRY